MKCSGPPSTHDSRPTSAIDARSASVSQVMSGTQDEYQPSLARFGIGLISLERDLVLGVRDTSTQVLLGEGGPVGAEDDRSFMDLYSDGSATGPYRLL